MAKNKSVAQFASRDNPAVRTGYQVKAQPVGTFVQGPSNTKGMQVAKALQQVSGDVDSFGASMAKVDAQEQAEAEKAAREATALQKDQARVLAAREAALFNEAQTSQNYNEDSTYDGSFDIFVNSEQGAGYATTRESLAENPQALAVFENTFKLQTEAPLIKVIGESVLKQKKDTVANMLPTIYKEAQNNNPTDPTAAFRATESQLFTRLTAKPEDGGYGLKNEIAADMLGDIFNTHALSRDENGRANTSLAEQYILSGKGGDAMREKLTLTILKQNSLAGSERNLKRTEDKIAEEKRTKELEVDIRSGKWKTPDANIFANNDLTDNQKTYLVDINRKVRKQVEIDSIPELKADAKKLFLQTKRDLMKAAVSEDFTAFGFAEGVVPTAEELETRLSELYLGKMSHNENDFNKLLESAQKSLSINEFIDSADSKKPLNTQFNQLKDQFKAKAFGGYMKRYSKKVLQGTPVLTHLHSELQREVHELVEEHVEAGNNLTNKTLSGFYEQAAQKVVQPIIDYVNSDNRKEFLDNIDGTEVTPTQSTTTTTTNPNLKTLNQAGAQAWEKASKQNGGYPNEAFLQAWDAQKLARPSTTPEEAVEKTAPEVVTAEELARLESIANLYKN